jgi:hypothetical protein
MGGSVSKKNLQQAKAEVKAEAKRQPGRDEKVSGEDGSSTVSSD